MSLEQSQPNQSPELGVISTSGALSPGISRRDATGVKRTKRCWVCSGEKSTLEFNALCARCRSCDRKHGNAQCKELTQAARSVGMTQTSLKSLPASKRASIVADYRASLSAREFLAEPSSPVPTTPVRYPYFRKLYAAPPAQPRAPLVQPTQGFIYIIVHPKQYEQDGVVKIGFTSNLAVRLAAANTWSHTKSFRYELYLPVSNMAKAESKIHAEFSDTRQDGEWFVANLEVAKMWLRMVAADFPPDLNELINE